MPFWLTILINDINSTKTLQNSISKATDQTTSTTTTTTTISSTLTTLITHTTTSLAMIASTTTKRPLNQYGLSVLRILRLTRVLRVLKLSRHVRALHIIGKILYECMYEIILLLTFLAMNIVIFSSFMYFIELQALGDASPFLSIPHAFWWAVISFTTIGYGKESQMFLLYIWVILTIFQFFFKKGDLIPHSNMGKFFGSFFIVCGILIALLPVPILSCKFERVYKEFSKENLKKAQVRGKEK